MNKTEQENFVVNYIKYLENSDDMFWVFNRFIDLIRDEPETAWILIKKILKTDSSLKMIADLSAGPLEDLLVDHGDKFIDRVEEEAKKNPDFAKLLGGVWKNAINDEVWERIQKVCDRSWDK